MKPLLNTRLFKFGTAAMAAATAGVAVLFIYALHVPTQPEAPGWRTTVIAAEADAKTFDAASIRVSAVSDTH
jgi:hypothetical protein